MHLYVLLYSTTLSISRSIAIASNGRLIGEQRIRKDLEGRGRGLTEIISRDLPRGTAENHANSQSVQSVSQQRFEYFPNTVTPACSVIQLLLDAKTLPSVHSYEF
jgi:hypothetical protein